MENKQQQLVDIIFQVGLTIKESKMLQEKTVEELAEWIVEQLKLSGFETKPAGLSWGVLQNEIRNN